MAPLIPEARAARAQAVRLRGETLSLKTATRERVAYSRVQLDKAERTLNHVLARRDEPLPSPWSTLLWLYQDCGLDRTLVPLP